MKFTTIDRDNDFFGGRNCGQMRQGAWWYNKCSHSNLNGLYLGGVTNIYADGMVWKTWRNQYYSFKTTQMMIKRNWTKSDKKSSEYINDAFNISIFLVLGVWHFLEQHFSNGMSFCRRIMKLVREIWWRTLFDALEWHHKLVIFYPCSTVIPLCVWIMAQKRLKSLFIVLF